jgi:hypothetical protein
MYSTPGEVQKVPQVVWILELRLSLMRMTMLQYIMGLNARIIEKEASLNF